MLEPSKAYHTCQAEATVLRVFKVNSYVQSIRSTCIVAEVTAEHESWQYAISSSLRTPYKDWIVAG